MIAAPTGIASQNVGGQTLHSLFFLPSNELGSSLYKISDRQFTIQTAKFKPVKYLFIDEISMVTGKNFMFLNNRLKQFKQSHQDFGEINIICSGDFYQLQPVRGEFVFKDPNSFIAWRMFRIFELTFNHRQQGDPLLLICNALRVGEIKKEHVDQLFTRSIDYIRLFDEQIVMKLKDILHIYARNWEVDRFNKTKINEMIEKGGKIELIRATDTIVNENMKSSI